MWGWSLRSPSAWLLALGVLLAGANVWSTFQRSGIPASLTGRVEHVEVRHEKHAGLDDVHLVRIAGREFHLDPEVALQLRVGDELRKDAWSLELTTPRGPAALGLSRDCIRMLLAMPLLLALAYVLLRRGAAAGGGEAR